MKDQQPIPEIVIEMHWSSGRKDICPASIEANNLWKSFCAIPENGEPILIIAHYCKSCHTLLNAMDQLDERATDVPSYEPKHKEDY